jgi:hypothetical protein
MRPSHSQDDGPEGPLRKWRVEDYECVAHSNGTQKFMRKAQGVSGESAPTTGRRFWRVCQRLRCASVGTGWENVAKIYRPFGRLRSSRYASLRTRLLHMHVYRSEKYKISAVIAQERQCPPYVSCLVLRWYFVFYKVAACNKCSGRLTAGAETLLSRECQAGPKCFVFLAPPRWIEPIWNVKTVKDIPKSFRSSFPSA